MALTTTRSLITYTGNGTQKVFTFPYAYLRAAHIRVTIIKANGDEVQLTPGTDFSVEPDSGTAGTVTLKTAPAAGEKVRIQRVVPLIQPESFPIQGPFDPQAVEALFDWQMMAIQQLSDGVGVHVHGIEPGGNLHALATEQDHGFLSKHDYAWMKQHQGSGTAHEIDQIRNLPDILTDIQLDLYNRAPVVHEHPISAIIGLRAELDTIQSVLDGKENAGAAVPWIRIIDHPTTLAGYGIVDGATIPFVEGKLAVVADELATKADKATTYTKTEVDTALSTKADKSTTYTKTEVDSALAAKANSADVYTKTQVDTALSTKANAADVYIKSEINTLLAGKENVGSDINWSRIINRPTTLSGYGIGDTYTKTEVDSYLATKANTADVYTKTQVDSALASKANIADVYTKTQVDNALSAKADKSTTYTKSEVDAALSAKANASSVYTKSEVNNLLGSKADKATSLAGYGILDAYTKTETNSLLVAKADKANTLAGYGITDAYTKVEVNTLLNALPIPQLYIARFVAHDREKYFIEFGNTSFYAPEAVAQDGVISVTFAEQSNPVMFAFSFGPPSGRGTISGHIGSISANKVEIVFTASEPGNYPSHFDIWAFIQP